MKKTILAFLLSLACISARAQAPTFSWVKAITPVVTWLPAAISTDAAGNVYAYTKPSYNCRIDSQPITPSFETALTKFDQNGRVVWSRPLRDFLGTDQAGNYYISGGVTTYDVDLGNGVIVPGNSRPGQFIAQYNNDGLAQWAARTTARGSSLEIQNIAVTSQNEVYLTGTFKDSVRFGSVVVRGRRYSLDGFVYKLDATGNVLWGQAIQGSVYDITNMKVTADPAGNVYVGGNTNGIVTIGGRTARAELLSSAFFVAKFSAAGAVNWLVMPKGEIPNSGSFSGNAELVNIAVNSSGSVAFAGRMSGVVRFGTQSIGDPGITYPPFQSMLGRISSNGSFIWGGRFATFEATAEGVAIDAANNIFVNGQFHGPDYDNQRIGTTFQVEAYFAKHSPNGTTLWAISSTSSRPASEGQGGAFDRSGNFYSIGSFKDTIRLGSYKRVSPDEWGMFIAKLGNSPVVATHPALGVQASDFYPNPTRGKVRRDGENAAGEVSVWNTLGRQVWTGIFQGSELDLSHLPDGLYWLQTMSPGGNVRQQLIIQH